MSREVSSLAGDRVVSHKRSRPADLSRRHSSRYAEPYPSDFVVAFLGMLFGRRPSLPECCDRRLTHFEPGQSLLPRGASVLWGCHAADLYFKSGRSLASSTERRSYSAEHHAQIVCGHFGDNRSRKSNEMRGRGNRFEV